MIDIISQIYNKYRFQLRVQIVTYKYWNIEIYILYTLLIKSYKYMYILRIKCLRLYMLIHSIITMMNIKLLKWLFHFSKIVFFIEKKETIETERERHKNTNLISIPYHRWLIIFLYKRLKFLFKSKTRYELNR